LGRSADHGETWESWSIVTGEDPLYFPYLAARGPGELAATWFSGSGETLRANVARIDRIDASPAAGPSVRSAAPFQLDSWIPRGESQVLATGGEYLPVVFLSDGDLGVAAPILNFTEERRGFSWYRASR
jgi:hypothetical protein